MEKDISLFLTSLHVTQHCVVGYVLSASYKLSGPVLHCIRPGKEGKETKTEVRNNVKTFKILILQFTILQSFFSVHFNQVLVTHL
jgi:hypothetical protein